MIVSVLIQEEKNDRAACAGGERGRYGLPNELHAVSLASFAETGALISLLHSRSMMLCVWTEFQHLSASSTPKSHVCRHKRGYAGSSVLTTAGIKDTCPRVSAKVLKIGFSAGQVLTLLNTNLTVASAGAHTCRVCGSVRASQAACGPHRCHSGLAGTGALDRGRAACKLRRPQVQGAASHLDLLSWLQQQVVCRAGFTWMGQTAYLGSISGR